MVTRYRSPKFYSLIFSLFAMFALVGCKEDPVFDEFIINMSNLVAIEAPADAKDDPCLLANGRAAANWYQSLSARHRETLKQNVQRYIRAVRFMKTEILSGVPTTMAQTSVSYDHGVVTIASRGVIDSNAEIICAPDIDVLVDLTADYSSAIASN